MWKWPASQIRISFSVYEMVVLVCLTVVAVLFGDTDQEIAKFIDHWQTLVAGLFALIAAWVSLSGPRGQIKQVDRLAAEAAAREEYAARAMLPIALSYINVYAKTCSKLTERKFEETRSAGNPIDLPAFDRSNLTIVRDSLKYAPPTYRDRMLALLSNIQELEVNATTYEPLFPEHTVFVSAIDVEFMSESLMNYAKEKFDTSKDEKRKRAHAMYVRMKAYYQNKDVDFWPNLPSSLDNRERFEIAVRALETPK